MNKLSKEAFDIFRLLLLLFTYFMFSMWNSRMTGGEMSGSSWVSYFSAILAFFCVYALMAGHSKSPAGIHLVCLAWAVIWPVFCGLQGDKALSHYVMPILWPLLYEATYTFCCQFESRCVSLRRTFILIAIYGGFLFALTRVDITMQTNTIYFCFLTLPWLLYNRKARLRVLLMVLFSLLALLSMKRSVMLSMVLCWSLFAVEYIVTPRRRSLFIVFSIAFLVGLNSVFDVMDQRLGGQLSERVNREETDEGKNRLAIWEITISMIKESSPTELVIGHGHMGVRRNSFLEISAHNDFLEVIYDYGLVVFALYLCLWGHVLRRWYQLLKSRSPLYLPYSVSLSIFVVMSMVSHLILYASYFNFLVMFWGAAEALHIQEKTIINNHVKHS
jgi:hypothetical protein